jgi:hypothetical protein
MKVNLYVGPEGTELKLEHEEDDSVAETMCAVGLLAELGHEIPSDLAPFVAQAVAVWQEQNKRVTRTEHNRQRRISAVSTMAHYVHHAGLDVEDAAIVAAHGYDEFSAETLRGFYYCTWSKPVCGAVEAMPSNDMVSRHFLEKALAILKQENPTRHQHYRDRSTG